MIPANAFLKQLQSDRFQIPCALLVYGEEPLYNQKSLTQFYQKTKALGYLQKDRYEVDGNFNWQDLQMDTQAGSLFADLRIIELDMPKGNPGREGTAFIQKWVAEQPPMPEILLVIRCEKLDSRQTKSKWVQTIESTGLVVQSRPIDSKQMPQWCQQAAQSVGLSLNHEAAQLLAERLEGNLLAADQELEKLALFFPQGQTLTAQDIIENVVDQAHYQLFALSTAMLEGKTNYALQVLKRLQQSEFEAPIVLWLLIKELRTLLLLIEKQNVMPLKQALQQVRIWKSKEAEYSAAVHRHDLNSCQGCLQDALAVDLAIKGMRKEDPWQRLSELVFSISQGQKLFA